MPGIDTSIYQIPQNNLLQQLGQVQGIANASEQNKLLQQEQQQRGIQIDLAKADRYKAQLEIEARELAALYAKEGGNPTRSHFVDAVANLGVRYPDLYGKKEIGNLPTMIPSDDEVRANPGAIKNTIIGLASQVEQARQTIEKFTPNIQPVNVGGVTRMLDTNVNSNPSIAGAAITHGLSPAELATPQTWTDANGQQHQGTRAEYLRATQGGNPNPGGGNVAPGTYFPGPAGSGGQQTPQLMRTGPLAENEGITVKHGTSEAQARVAQTGADQVSDLQKAFEGSNDIRAQLSNLEAMRKQFTSGPLSGKLYKGAAAANEFLPEGWQIKAGGVAAYEEFQKLAQQLAQQQMKAMGGQGSDDRLASALVANPHAALSSYGLERIIAMLKGNNDALSKKFETWNSEQS